MLSKNQMREFLTSNLEELGVSDSDEVADTLVDRLEDEGGFEETEEE